MADLTDFELCRDPYYVPGSPTFRCYCETADACPMNVPKSCFVGANSSTIPPAGLYGNSEANCATPQSLYSSALNFMAKEDGAAAAVFMTGDFGESGNSFQCFENTTAEAQVVQMIMDSSR